MIHLLERQRQQYQLTKQRLVGVNPEKKIEQVLQQENFFYQKLVSNMQTLLREKRHHLAQAGQQLNDYSPLMTLDRGYAYVTDDTQKTITSVDQLKKNNEININFKDGKAQAVVKAVRRNENGN